MILKIEKDRMKKFNYKKWIVEQKFGRNPMGKPDPIDRDDIEDLEREPQRPSNGSEVSTMCAPAVATQACYRFSKCINDVSDGTNEARAMGGMLDPVHFYDKICNTNLGGNNTINSSLPQGCNPGDVMIDNLGDKWIYEGTGTNVNTVSVGAPNSATPAYCGACTNCCCQQEGPNLTEQFDKYKSYQKSDFIDNPDMAPSDREVPTDFGFVAGCRQNTSFPPNPLTQDPVTGMCECDGPNNPYPISTVISVHNPNYPSPC
jgi:hypothetical protein